MSKIDEAFNRVYQKAAVSKNDSCKLGQGTALVQEKVTKCPWCGNQRIMIRPQDIFGWSCCATQCTRCLAWGPMSNPLDSVKNIVNQWNWRHNSWSSFVNRFKAWWQFRCLLKFLIKK